VVPEKIVRGDSAAFDLIAPGYSSPEWSGTVTWRTGSGAAVSVVGTASGGGWSFNLTTALSQTMSLGVNVWDLALSKTGERRTISTGQTKVFASLSEGNPLVTETFWQKWKTALEAVALTQLASGSVTVQIGDHQRTFMSLDEWRAAYAEASERVRKEEEEARLESGKGSGKKVLVHFTCP